MIHAGEAVAAGAAGLVYVRIEADGGIDAAKPVKEGLTEQQVEALIASTSAQAVRNLLLPFGSNCQTFPSQ
jgi:aspartyl-tRNA synthetase